MPRGRGGRLHNGADGCQRDAAGAAPHQHERPAATSQVRAAARRAHDHGPGPERPGRRPAPKRPGEKAEKGGRSPRAQPLAPTVEEGDETGARALVNYRGLPDVQVQAPPAQAQRQDYLLMEQEFIGTRRFKHEEKDKKDKMEDIRGSPLAVGSLEEMIGDNIIVVGVGPMRTRFCDVLRQPRPLEPGCSVLLHSKVMGE